MRLIFPSLFCLICLFGIPANAQTVTTEMKAVFLNKLKTSIEQKDFDLFSTLICKDTGPDQETADAADKNTRDTFTSIISSLAPEYEFTSLPRGQTYNSEIKPMMLIKITPSQDSSTPFGVHIYSFPLCVKEGSLLIVQTAEKTQ